MCGSWAHNPGQTFKHQTWIGSNKLGADLWWWVLTYASLELYIVERKKVRRWVPTDSSVYYITARILVTGHTPSQNHWHSSQHFKCTIRIANDSDIMVYTTSRGFTKWIHVSTFLNNSAWNQNHAPKMEESIDHISRDDKSILKVCRVLIFNSIVQLSWHWKCIWELLFLTTALGRRVRSDPF